MSIHKIVVTGGPCGGKTTALSRIQRDLGRLGYTVLIVPETATSLISGGVAPWTCGSNEQYQRCQMRMQADKESVFEEAAHTMKSNKILIVCDRGQLDNKVYMTEEEFGRVITSLNMSEEELKESYDAIFHLVTAAKGAEKYYTLDNNGARIETPEEAAELDDRFIAAWCGHPYLRVIDNRAGFEDKMRRLIREISYFLGELAPFEIERKFLIEYPDVAWLESLPNCKRIEISQSYLISTPDREVRVRRRSSKAGTTYYLTDKRLEGNRKHLETRRRITHSEYRMLCNQTDHTLREISKTRYCLTYEGQYFEVDVFPCWNDQALMQIELSDENAPISIPPELHVIREVTGEQAYRNAVIASKPRGATH